MEAGQRWRHTRGAAVDMGPPQLGAQNANLRMSMSSTTPARTMSGRYLRNRACTRSEGWVEGGACSRSCPLSGPTASCPLHHRVGSGAPPAGMHEGRPPRLVIQVLGLDRKLLGILAQHVAHLRHACRAGGKGDVVGARRSEAERETCRSGTCASLTPRAGKKRQRLSADVVQPVAPCRAVPSGLPAGPQAHGLAAPPAPTRPGCCASSRRAPAGGHQERSSCQMWRGRGIRRGHVSKGRAAATPLLLHPTSRPPCNRPVSPAPAPSCLCNVLVQLLDVALRAAVQVQLLSLLDEGVCRAGRRQTPAVRPELPGAQGRCWAHS